MPVGPAWPPARPPDRPTAAWASQVKDPSLLRFLVDMRGEDATNKQLRDDLMTMLIAGHETTAAVLTWALFCLTQHPEAMAKVRCRAAGTGASVLGAAPQGWHIMAAFCVLPSLQAVHRPLGAACF